MPARIPGYDARAVPFDDDDEQQGEPVGAPQQDEPAEETQPDEPAKETRSDEPHEEPSPEGSAQAELHPVPAEDDADDSEDEWAAPPYEAGAASDDEEEWGAPPYQEADGEEGEEEPYYEYAAPYADPFAGFRDLRGGNIRPW